jgi:hypothetical protein
MFRSIDLAIAAPLLVGGAILGSQSESPDASPDDDGNSGQGGGDDSNAR